MCAHQITSCFPREELYGLTSQLRRAGSSIPAYLAEGAEEKGVPSLRVIARLLWDRRASWSITCCLPEI
ncbi:MAG: four helix bundle protein [Acidobacteriaceae bacterium]|nr:four helix bundle protein [Acidobacteriaceae bacterium]